MRDVHARVTTLAPPNFKNNHWFTTPLHIATAMSLRCQSGEARFSVPAFVQLVIKAGSSVHDVDIFGYTSLQALMCTVCIS